MIRVLGFLLGVGTVATGFWVLSNTPEGARIGADAYQAVSRAWGRVAASVPDGTEAFPARVQVTESGGRTWRSTEPPAAAPLASQTTTTPTPQAPTAQSVTGVEEASSSVPIVEPARRWHTFWQAFHRKTSARGFADRLAALTGLEFTVIDQGDGTHAVAFAYRDEHERRTHLAYIRTQTGLAIAAE